jgi:Ni,Fe-hydrogenase III small subunit
MTQDHDRAPSGQPAANAAPRTSAGLGSGIAVPPSPDASAGDTRQDQQVARQLRERIAAQFGRSLHIRTLDTGSCAVCEQEIRLLAAPHYDLHRLGFFFTPAPRHADLLMVTGPMIRAFSIAARKTYEAMPGPKIVVATGACALGGVYPADPFVHGSAGEVLPVDVWIPGCPPSPLALLQGLLVAVGRLAEKAGGLSFIADDPTGEEAR